MHAGFLKPVKHVEYCLPVVVSEVVLDLINVHVCCSDPLHGRELVCAQYVVTAVV